MSTMDFKAIADQFFDSNPEIHTALELELARVYQEGLVTGSENRAEHQFELNLATIKVLSQRNEELHRDKHQLRVTPCHQCGAYPKL